MSKSNNSKNDYLELLLGIVLLSAGLFMLSKRVVLHSSWLNWRLGNIDLASGTVTIPLIIGIIWYFFNTKSIVPKILIGLGILFIIITIIMNIRINFMPTSLFDYILIFIMAGAGSGLLLRYFFKKRE